MKNKERNIYDLELKKRIQQNPEQYQEEYHKHLFTKEEIKDLSMSMGGAA